MASRQAEDIRWNLSAELRRGVLVLAVLAALDREKYGYSLKTDLAGEGIEIDEGTLYPLLRRLETQGFLQSRWVVADGRPRRYYVLNAAGRRMLQDLAAEWRSISTGVNGLLK